MAQKQLHHQQLREIGLKLESPPPSKDSLIKLLKQLANYLSEVDQSPSTSTLEALKPSLDALVKAQLLKHQDKDVKVLVATCICELTRITAPEPPYSDEVLRDIFHLFVWSFNGLSDVSSPSFGRRVVILETLARYRLFLMMLDLECTDLINEMCRIFLAVVSDNHSENILLSMWTIMTLILDESEDIEEHLLSIILSKLGRKEGGQSPVARNLAMKVIKHCSDKLEAPIKQFLLSSISGDPSASTNIPDCHEVIYDIYQCAPQVLHGVIPYITGELLTDKLDVRLKTVNLLGDLFTLHGISIPEFFKPLFSEFLKRLTDRVVEVRLSVVEHSKNCLISDASGAEAPNIISALSDRLLDFDEHVRKKVVAAICDVVCNKLNSVPSATVKITSERLRDKSVSVKWYTMERLTEIYKLYCQDTSGSLSSDDFEWIPGKILRCLYDRDFRFDTIEGVLCNSLFPTDLSAKDKMKHWMSLFSCFDKAEVKALEQLLVQKQRLQNEMLKYLSLRQTGQDGDGHEHQKKLSGCFRLVARFFSDPVKAEESFQFLNQIKDANFWRNLSHLVDPSSTFRQSLTCRDELLGILGDKHPLYDFTSTLSMKISFLFINKEIIKEILSEISACVSDRNDKLLTCMKLLAVFASFFPLLFSGFEEDLVSLLKEDNEVIKEGVAHVLAKSGGVIREKLTTTSSSVDLLLERLCLEGSRKQAKYAVQALAAITKDDGLKSLSVLYKRLVDMLEKRTHLPSILQSLGSIAQNAMPIFETREGEIVDFVTDKILQCSNDFNSEQKVWSDQSDLCKLKIYGLKALGKSFLPIRDAHLRTGIGKLLENLKNILIFGEISKDISSSLVDKAHMKLAAAKTVLRLSRQWDEKIPVDLVYTVFKFTQDTLPEARKTFKSKVHQYIKERSLDAKYACVFLFNIVESHPPDYSEDKHNLIEIVQMHHQLKARHLSTQSDVNSSVSYPEYILPWFIHALAHHPSFPSIDNSEDFHAFEPTYRRLHLLLSALLLGDESLKSDNSSRVMERFSAVASIFQCIKFSEDAIDENKAKNSHALCDLGLSIAKQLAHEKENPIKLKNTAPLPSEIYKQHERDGDNFSVANGGESWLGGAAALAHFQSIKLEDKVNPDSVKSEPTLSDVDIDANDLPLGTIMKSLKLQAAKRKKMMKTQPCNSQVKNLENEVDILGVVREINLSNQEEETMGNQDLGKENKCSTTGLLSTPKKSKKKDLSQKVKANSDRNAIPSLVPKRKRSSYGTSPRSVKDRKSGQSRSIPKGSAMDEKTASDSDLLVSCMSVAKSVVSGGKRIKTHQNVNGKSYTTEDENDLRNISLPGKFKGELSALSSGKKRKRKSIAGLEKCSQKIVGERSELIGCKVKVWWPLDKKYYEGKVQSYDEIQKKHVILYNDGDVEVLCLDKERWELIDSDEAPKKKLKAQDPCFGDLSLDEKDKTSKDNSIKKFIKKRGTKRNNSGSKTIKRKSNRDSHDSPRNGSSSKSGGRLQHNKDKSDSQVEAKKTPQSKDIAEADIESVGKSSEAEEEGSSSSSEQPNSDDEPLNVWRQRVGKQQPVS